MQNFSVHKQLQERLLQVRYCFDPKRSQDRLRTENDNLCKMEKVDTIDLSYQLVHH